MKNKVFSKVLISFLLALTMFLCASCSPSASGFNYQKQSDELMYFKSSDEDLDFFLNDYFKRHSGVIENGLDQKVNSVTAGVSAVQFFWQEWNSMSYYWHNSRDGYDTDRIEGIRKILSNIPVDDYGYVWQETDAVRTNDSTVNTGEHRMGWPFPTSFNVSGSTSWDFNASSAEKPWTVEIVKNSLAQNDENARILNNLFLTNVNDVESVVFCSPVAPTIAYYSPLLEIDLRMYSSDCQNIDDIIVHYQTTKTGNSTWKQVSVKEKAFINYEFTPAYEHLIFLPMYAEEDWGATVDCKTYVTKLKVEIKAKEGTEISGRFGLNYVRSTFDTRHSNNNSIFISSLRNDFDYTGDLEYLKENITKARKAINFYMQMYDEDRHLNDQSYLVGHDSDKTGDDKSKRVAKSLANGYWDISYMTKYDFQSNMYFYKALKDLAYLETILTVKGISVDKSLATVKTADRNYVYGESEYTHTSQTLTSIANAVLAELRKSINDSDKTGFWNEKTGRFVGGYSQSEQKWYDYGYVMWNLESIYYGVATDEQAKSIMEWINGDRVVDQDKYGSQGKDIYYYEFAPRVNTYSSEEQNDGSIFNGSYENPSCIYGETQVQNGGAIMYVSFFDLVSRVRTLGADNAFERLEEIKDWYGKIYEYYKNSDNYNKNPDRFYWDYYENSQWKGKYVPLQNGVKGTKERSIGPNGVLGIDGEFLESFLMISAIPYGFFGLSASGGNTLIVNPSVPKGLKYWGMENLSFNGVKYDLTVFKNSARIDSVRGNSNGLKVKISLSAKGNNPKVFVNGKEYSDFVLENGKVIVSVPLKSVVVEVK